MKKNQVNYATAPTPVIMEAKTIALSMKHKGATIEDIALALKCEDKIVAKWIEKPTIGTTILTEFAGNFDYRTIPDIVRIKVKTWMQNSIKNKTLTMEDLAPILGVKPSSLYSWTRKDAMLV
jgi:hypothetical protein